MGTYPLRVFVSLVAILGLLLTDVAVAQDDAELLQSRSRCWAPAKPWMDTTIGAMLVRGTAEGDCHA